MELKPSFKIKSLVQLGDHIMIQYHIYTTLFTGCVNFNFLWGTEFSVFSVELMYSFNSMPWVDNREVSFAVSSRDSSLRFFFLEITVILPPPIGFSCTVSQNPASVKAFISTLTWSALYLAFLVITLQGTLDRSWTKQYFLSELVDWWWFNVTI